MPKPVLVGGAAAEFYSAGAITTGDYDLVTQDQAEVEAALMALGFEKPRDGTRGLHHCEANVGVEIVGSELLDGHADRTRILEVEIAEGLIIKQRQPLLSPQVGAAIERDRGEEDHAGKLGMTKGPRTRSMPHLAGRRKTLRFSALRRWTLQRFRLRTESLTGMAAAEQYFQTLASCGFRASRFWRSVYRSSASKACGHALCNSTSRPPLPSAACPTISVRWHCHERKVIHARGVNTRSFDHGLS